MCFNSEPSLKEVDINVENDSVGAMFRRFSVLVVMLFVVSMRAQGEPRYSVTLIPGPPGAYGICEGDGINSKGEVVGYSGMADWTTNTHEFHGYLYTGGRSLDLGSLASGRDSYAVSINANGQVAGYAYTASGDLHAAVYENNQWSDLGTVAGNESLAISINDSGDVVGTTSISDSSTDFHAFLYQNGRMRDIQPPNLVGLSRPWAINKSGQVVMSAEQTGGPWRLIIYQNGEWKDISPVQTDCFAHAMNDRGDIVGEAQDTPFLVSSGKVTWLPKAVSIEAINNSQQMVGYSWTSENYGEEHGFVEQDGQAEDLNDLIPASVHCKIFEAKAINDNGQIVGYGGVDGVSGTFLLTPIPSSASGTNFDPGTEAFTTRPTVTVAGTSKGVVLRVLYRVGHRPLRTAIGANKWHFPAKLSMGRNRIAVIIERPQGHSRPVVYYITREKK